MDEKVAATLFDADVTTIDVYSDDTSVIGDFEFDQVPRIGESLLICLGAKSIGFRVTDVCHLGDSNEGKRGGFDYPGSNSLHLTVKRINAPNQ